MRAAQVFKEGSPQLRPAREHDARRMVMVHRLGQTLRKSKKARSAVTRERDAAECVNDGAVATLPTELHVLFVGVLPVVDHEVQPRRHSRTKNQLRYLRSNAKSPPSPDLRSRAHEPLNFGTAAAQIPDRMFER